MVPAILYFIATDFRGFKGFLLETGHRRDIDGTSTGLRLDMCWNVRVIGWSSTGHRLDMRWSAASPSA